MCLVGLEQDKSLLSGVNEWEWETVGSIQTHRQDDISYQCFDVLKMLERQIK